MMPRLHPPPTKHHPIPSLQILAPSLRLLPRQQLPLNRGSNPSVTHQRKLQQRPKPGRHFREARPCVVTPR
jgi:hypothetical protein